MWNVDLKLFTQMQFSLLYKIGRHNNNHHHFSLHKYAQNNTNGTEGKKVNLQ